MKKKCVWKLAADWYREYASFSTLVSREWRGKNVVNGVPVEVNAKEKNAFFR